MYASVFSFNYKEGFLTCHSLLQQERLKLLAIRMEAPLYIYTAINYDSTVRFVGDDHRKRTSRRRAPPIQFTLSMLKTNAAAWRFHSVRVRQHAVGSSRAPWARCERAACTL